MKKRMIILFCLCIAVLVTACSRRGGEGEPSSPQSRPSDEGSATPSVNDGGSGPPASVDAGEERGDAGQPDPTLPENQAGGFYRWNHVEYREFGDVSTYQRVGLELIEYTEHTPEVLNATMLLPICCTADGVINYDGGFAGGVIKIGGPPVNYYKLKDGETITRNELFPFESFSANPMSGESYAMRESAGNVVGAYLETPRFMRYVGQGPGPAETRLLQYVVDLGGGVLTSLYFYVSPEASSVDLEIYDAIANSVELSGPDK